MDFSKTYYNRKFYPNKNNLQFSKTNLNFFKKNIILRNSLNNKYNSFSIDNNKNHILSAPKTNKIISRINKIALIKSNKHRKMKANLTNFHTEVIRLKIRENDNFKPFLDKYDSESVFQTQNINKKFHRRMNFKSDKNFFRNNFKTINCFYGKNSVKSSFKNIKNPNSIMIDRNKNKNKISNNNFSNYKLLSDNINKTNFTTMGFSSGGNNSIEKSLSSIYKRKKEVRLITNGNEFNEKSNNKENNNNDLNDNKNKVKNIFILNNDHTKINNEPSINSNYVAQTENNIYSNKQSFITSLNYSQPPPFQVKFREQNLLNFYSKIRDLIYRKYFLFLQKKNYERVKETSQFNKELHSMDIFKFIRFYKLFKPYNYYLEKYLAFLKNKIKLEYKQNEKLKILKTDLLTDVLISHKKLLKIHKRLKGYLNDKFVLLCVKNFTLNLESFEEKDKNEFEQDLKTFEILKNYINELSEINFQDFGSNKRKSTIATIKQRTSTNSPTKRRNSLFRKKTNININDKEKDIIIILKNSRMHFPTKPVFESISEFNEYMDISRKNIESLLLKSNRINIETANLRDHYLQHEIDKDIEWNKNTYTESDFDIIEQKLSLVKARNTKLNIYKKKIVKMKKIKIIRVVRKIKEIINTIFEQGNKSLNKMIIKKNINKPILALKELEKIINYLLEFKRYQKNNNKEEYNKVVKDIDKKKRLLIIKLTREENENKIEKKSKDLIEKEMKIFNINDRRTNINIRPPGFKKETKKDENSDQDKDSIDITY